ncbi:MAG TPA: hypothetical protein VHO03_14435 [Ignavibacteriales bacterium]|nr:hypothetical protein [Ignavibacteriales bacterium]
MRRMKNHLILLAAVLIMASVKIDAQINAGISVGPRGLNGFYMRIGSYFRVPQREVIIVRDRKLPDEEIPVVFFVARRAGVSPREVAAVRCQGYSWTDITYRFGLGPEIFFPGRVFQGPPYGKAWGYYKHRRRSYISDYDIIRAVNSRMNSESYYGRENYGGKIRERGSYQDKNDVYNGNGRDSGDDYNYHNRDNRNNNDNRNDNYGYGDPKNR